MTLPSSSAENQEDPLNTPKRIILMDLNVALSENFSEMKHHSFINFITSEEKYRLWLIDLLREEYVIVITARDIKWKEQTLKRIFEESGWNPQEALFNDTGISGQKAPEIKKAAMEKYVLPVHGEDANYLAIESNASTRSMYKKLGIKAIDCMRDGSWSEIPNE